METELIQTSGQTELSALLRKKEEAFRVRGNEAPFLSVIIRTQGKRPETLKEALLSLNAQSDRDFEVLLVVHKGSDEDFASVEQMVGDEPEEFRSRIRVLRLNDGMRAAPLNLGAKEARGAYFAMLDDDDLIFENWVENFHNGAKECPDTVIRCYAVTQPWEAVKTGSGEIRLRSDGPMREDYCRKFNLVRQLEENYTPISCVAIPTACHHDCGIFFDDTLTTAEDWDYLMRAIALYGVYDTCRITFLYRLWKNTESSRTLHSRAEWLRNREKIMARFNKTPIITDRQTLLGETDHAFLLSMPSQTVSGLGQMPESPYSFRVTSKRVFRLIRNCLRSHLRRGFYIRTLAASEYFDREWYLENYADVRQSGIDPVKHYLLFGWYELRNPSPIFSTRSYLEKNPDVFEEGICPLLHYELSGRDEERIWE